MKAEIAVDEGKSSRVSERQKQWSVVVIYSDNTRFKAECVGRPEGKRLESG